MKPLNIRVLPFLQFLALGAPLAAFSATASAQDFDSGVYMPIRDVVWNVPGGATVTANGNVSLSFRGLGIDGDVDDQGQLNQFSATVPLRGAFTLDLVAQASGTFTGEVALPLIPLPSFQLGPNVTVEPFVFTEMHVSGTIDANVRGSFVIPFSIEAGLQLPGNVGLTQPPRFHPTATPPDIAQSGMDVHVSCEIGTCFLVTIEGIPVGGPALTVELGARLNVDPSANPWWTATGLVRVEGSWGFPELNGGLSSFPASQVLLFRRQFHIGNAPGALPPALASTHWSRIYDIGDNEEATTAHPAGNNFVVFGNGMGVGNRTWNLQLDGNGNIQLQNLATLQAFGSFRPAASCVATNGDSVVAGFTATSGGMRVERYNSSGTPLWARTFAGPPSTLVEWTTMLATANNTVILGGNLQYVLAPSPRYAIFAEVDSAGNQLWVKTVDCGLGSSNIDVLNMAWAPNNEILAVGMINYSNNPDIAIATQNLVNALVIRLASDGTVIRANSIGARGWEEARCVAVQPNGDYAIGGAVPIVGFDAEAHCAWIAKFNSSDELIWSSVYAGEIVNGSAGDTGYDQVRSLVAQADGGFLAMGGTGLGTQRDAWLFRVDDIGMPEWFKSYRGASTDYLYGFMPSQFGIFAYGYTQSQNDVLPFAETDLWLMRTGVDGMLTFTQSSGMQAYIDQVKWVPAHYTDVDSLEPVNLVDTLTPSAAPITVAATAAIVELLTQ